ncbi:MAG: SufD family Fe-S cluster assembly protein [Alphaproteobacteria bacterium]|nr:SufD family Fe-S cluster assembly protein [Alphaproteobacteria bacterium]
MSKIIYFENGKLCRKDSDFKDIYYFTKKKLISITKQHKEIIKIQYLGEITGKKCINLHLSAKNTKIEINVNIKNKKPAFLEINIENAGKNSSIINTNIIKNYKELTLNINCKHSNSDTTIYSKTKVLADKKTITKLLTNAEISKKALNSNSDISLGVMAEETSIVTLIPKQNIKSVPLLANHSAFLYKPNKEQIEYLYNAGYDNKSAKKILKEAFLKE